MSSSVLLPPRSDTDRNLLFGVLALQAGLLDSARFADACSGWAARKDASLADLLAERGWLSAADRAVIDHLVKRRLEQAGGDVHASLAAAAGPAERRILAGIDDDAVRASIAPEGGDDPHFAATQTSHPDDRDPAARSTLDFRSAGTIRYELTQLHAVGGIGQVWVARDGDLGRSVALKELRPHRANQAASVARFLEEARITGQLEHPNIVPVYEYVRATPGRPAFYTMRFLKGRTLSEAARDYHEKRQIGTAATAEFRTMLRAVVAAGHAIAYAHSRGVLHRDVKGANVVLGDFGEVVVLDWGLAKVVGKPELEAPPVESDPLGRRDETVQGQVLGTPAFMPPEQAAGKLEEIDHRSDVYGLGAILYEVLTGKAPYTGADTWQVLHQVLHEKPAAPRVVNRDAPRALEAVCLRAMARNPVDRYPTAKAVVDELEHFLADEPVTAYREPVLERFGRRLKRNRTLAAALLVAAVVLIPGFAVVAEVERRNAAELAKEEANTRAAKNLAEQRLQEATNVWYTQVIDVHNELDDQNISPVLRQKLLRSAREKIVDLLKDQPRSREVDHMMHVLHRRLADSSLSLGQLDEAEREWAECHRIAEARFKDDPDGPDSRRDLGSAHLTLGSIKARANDLPAALAAYEQAGKLFDAQAAAFPDDKRVTGDRLVLANRVGTLHARAGRANDAVAAYEAGLALARSASAADPGHVGFARDRFLLAIQVGDTVLRAGRLKEALDRFEEALAVTEGLRARDPDNLQFVRDRAETLWSLGDLEFKRDRTSAARRYYQQALDLHQQLADRPGAPPQAFLDVALTFQGLGSVSNHSRDYPRAVVEFSEQVRNIRKALARGDDPARQQLLAAALVRLGYAQQGDGRWREARKSLTDSLTIRRELRQKGKGEAQLVVDEAEAHSYLAFLEREAPYFDLQTALEHSRDGVALLDPLEKAGRFDGNPEWKRTADTHRQNVAYLEWAVKVLDPVAEVRTRSSPDKALALRAKVTAGRGLAGEALATAAALERLPKTQANLLAAKAYAQAAAAAGPPSPWSTAGAKAVELLAAYAEDGGDLTPVAYDADFDPLRAREDYRKLMAK